jgi:hypothetical protein
LVVWTVPQVGQTVVAGAATGDREGLTVTTSRLPERVREFEASW